MEKMNIVVSIRNCNHVLNSCVCGFMDSLMRLELSFLCCWVRVKDPNAIWYVYVLGASETSVASSLFSVECRRGILIWIYRRIILANLSCVASWHTFCWQLEKSTEAEIKTRSRWSPVKYIQFFFLIFFELIYDVLCIVSVIFFFSSCKATYFEPLERFIDPNHALEHKANITSNIISKQFFIFHSIFRINKNRRENLHNFMEKFEQKKKFRIIDRTKITLSHPFRIVSGNSVIFLHCFFYLFWKRILKIVIQRL